MSLLAIEEVSLGLRTSSRFVDCLDALHGHGEPSEVYIASIPELIELALPDKPRVLLRKRVGILRTEVILLVIRGAHELRPAYAEVARPSKLFESPGGLRRPELFLTRAGQHLA